MKRLFCYIVSLILLSAALCGCGEKKAVDEQKEESRQAKQLLQGIWMDEETEAVVFRIKGDSVFYADSTSMPAYFKVVDDTLYVGSTVRYFIEKHTEHLLWFRNLGGELVKYVKSDDVSMDTVFEQTKPQILTLTEVLKRDTVVFYNNNRYHCYVAINPTKYRVVKQTVNEDGLNVENVYYDNIIHISIYQGAKPLFSRDFNKQFYAKKVPAGFLAQAILNDMQYSKTDAEGFHFSVSLCVPDDASCYLIDQTVSFGGKVTSKLLEY